MHHASDLQRSQSVSADSPEEVLDDRYWKKDGWIARVIKNEDDEGWAVEMTRVGDTEPALVGPWTMGRDKKNPKPLDAGAFATLTKTAREVLLRHEQAEHARLHKSRVITDDAGMRVRVQLDIVQDEDDPHAILSSFEATSGEPIASQRVQASFSLNEASAQRFVRTEKA
jgi:hypothetical protein